jgi:methyltransferase (TIGR00027 family)
MPLIRNISDTARWVAIYRARESERANALFRDPFAGRLAGERGEQIARSLPHSEKNSWSWVTRTHIFDQLIMSQIEQGCDTVINLAAGLDARPYRLTLPEQLKWIEVDLPEISDYKEEILRDENPSCVLERVRLDLSDLDERRKLFQRMASQASRALIVSEGLIIYLTPAEGAEFYRSSGWKPIDVRSMLHTAGRLKRLPLLLSLMYRIQRSDAYNAKRPWAGVCLLEHWKGAQ